MDAIGMAETMEKLTLVESHDQKKQEEELDEGIATEEGPAPPGEIESSDSIQFHPPVYLQRYAAVIDLLKSFLDQPCHRDMINGRTVLEVGCAEFGMLKFFKTIVELGKLIFLDIDEQLLTEKRIHLRPFPAEHLLKISRPKPLVVEAYAGDISKVDKKILDESPRVWAVVAIELIEHLYPPTLRGFEVSVFGVIRPSLVVVTTPNSDFNPIFNLTPGNFRHWDHKFEWSRAEFVEWCNKICAEFVNYTYTVSGICPAPMPPEEAEKYGCVSQMAVFKRTDEIEMQLDTEKLYPGVVVPSAYKLIETITYPNFVELRKPEQVVLDELNYTINTYWFSQRNIENYNETGVSEVFFPLTNLQRACRDVSATGITQNLEWLKSVLEAAEYEVLLDKDDQYVIKLQVPSIYDIPDKDVDDDTWLTTEDMENMDGVEDSGTSINSVNDIEESWE